MKWFIMLINPFGDLLLCSFFLQCGQAQCGLCVCIVDDANTHVYFRDSFRPSPFTVFHDRCCNRKKNKSLLKCARLQVTRWFARQIISITVFVSRRTKLTSPFIRTYLCMQWYVYVRRFSFSILRRRGLYFRLIQSEFSSRKRTCTSFILFRMEPKRIWNVEMDHSDFKSRSTRVHWAPKWRVHCFQRGRAWSGTVFRRSDETYLQGSTWFNNHVMPSNCWLKLRRSFVSQRENDY